MNTALEWAESKGLIFDYVNENAPEVIDSFGSDTRKIFADEYIDDRAINPSESIITREVYLDFMSNVKDKLRVRTDNE